MASYHSYSHLILLSALALDFGYGLQAMLICRRTSCGLGAGGTGAAWGCLGLSALWPFIQLVAFSLTYVRIYQYIFYTYIRLYSSGTFCCSFALALCHVMVTLDENRAGFVLLDSLRCSVLT